jgi:hypothetical protein
MGSSNLRVSKYVTGRPLKCVILALQASKLHKDCPAFNEPNLIAVNMRQFLAESEISYDFISALQPQRQD